MKKLEARIEALEGSQKEVTEALGDPAVYADAKKRNELLSKFEEGKDELNKLTASWETLTLEIEAKEAELAEESP